MDKNTIEGIHSENVTAWFREHLEGVKPPLSFSLITGGRSNLTYRVEDAAQQVYVLRRPPLGLVLESAHNMAREFRIISALGKTDIPVAPALGLCLDRAVNEADFYVMRFVHGRVYENSLVAESIPMEERKPLCLDVFDCLVRLHRIDPDSVGLGDLGKKEAYVARQVRRWTRQYQDSKTEEIPEMEEVGRLLSESIPAQAGATIAHGDYRPGNIIVHDYRVAAILDWELCTLGDPLADLGYLLNWWIHEGEVERSNMDSAPTALPGMLTRDHLIEYYADKTGRDVGRINYYRALSYWRLAAISQGVYRRYLEGVMGEGNREVEQHYRNNVRLLSRLALQLLT